MVSSLTAIDAQLWLEHLTRCEIGLQKHVTGWRLSHERVRDGLDHGYLQGLVPAMLAVSLVVNTDWVICLRFYVVGWIICKPLLQESVALE
jgi:hypothetical protein